MKSKKIGHAAPLLVILALASAEPIRGQLAAPVPSVNIDTLRLEEVYRLSRARNPRVAAAAAFATAAGTRVQSARRLPDPEIQLGFMNRSLPSLAPMDPLGMTQVQVVQMLPAPGKLSLAGRVAAQTAAAARARATEIAWDMRAQAAMTFYDLYAIDAQLGIATDTKKLVQDIAKIAQAMYAVGDGKQAEVLGAQLEIAKMTEEITRMEGMRAAMSGRLAALLDLPGDTTFGTLVPGAIPDFLPPLSALIGEAERNRPMIAAGEYELGAATTGERLARKETWPDVQVGVQYGWRGGTMGTERMGSLMIGATLPIYARSRQLRMREEADAMRTMAAADVAAMRAETRGRMSELYADFMRATNLIALYRTTVLPQSEATVRSSLSAYRVGSVNLMTLLDNQMTVNRYRQELVSLQATRGKAIAEIEMFLGRELLDTGQTTRVQR